jgi:hypothetical protein
MHQHPSQGGPVLPTNPRTFAELGVSARTEGALRMRGIDGPFEIQGLVKIFSHGCSSDVLLEGAEDARVRPPARRAVDAERRAPRR